jgi:hypothetical protein
MCLTKFLIFSAVPYFSDGLPVKVTKDDLTVKIWTLSMEMASTFPMEMLKGLDDYF